MKGFLAVLGVAVLLSASVCAEALEYKIVDLGVANGGATAINDKGQVVGYANGSVVLWENGTARTIFYGGASDINNSGQVVGSTGDGNHSHALLWQNNTSKDLGTLGGTYSYATGINNSGQIVGYSDITGQNVQHAFLWQHDVMQDLGTLGFIYSEATSINDDGLIAGTAFSYGTTHPFTYANGSMVDTNVTMNEPLKINNSGVIGANTVVNRYWHATLLVNGVLQDLGGLGNTGSNFEGLNNNGWVVGYSRRTNSSDNHAFVWHDGAMQDLGTLGGLYSGAYGINDNGWICGSSTDVNGVNHAVLWQLVTPEPSSILTLLCGIGTLGGLVSRRRRA